MALHDRGLPLVSVCMPAYNHERYVQEAIQSVIDQDYPRIELIVTDDGSPDGTWKKIEAMRDVCERRFERVAFQTRPNKGCAVTCQENRELIRGEYCCVIDSDDCFLPGAISALIKPMLSDEGIGLSVGINIIIDAKGNRCYWDDARNIVYEESKAKFKTFDAFIEDRTGVDLDGGNFGRYGSLLRGNHVPNGYLFRRTSSEGMRFDRLAPLEDLWLHLQLSKVARYSHVKIPTFCYRWHGANTAARRQHMRAITAQTLLHELNCLEQNNETSKWADEFRQVMPDITFPVCGLRLGRNHYPRVVRQYRWKNVQYRFLFSRFNIPLSPVFARGCG